MKWLVIMSLINRTVEEKPQKWLGRTLVELANWWTYHKIMKRGSKKSEHPDQFAIDWLRYRTGRFDPLPYDAARPKPIPPPPRKRSRKARTGPSQKTVPTQPQPPPEENRDPPSAPAAQANVVPIRPDGATGTDNTFGCG
jgi:hypothetical protein